MDVVSDRLIRAAGTPDSVWLPWLAQQPLRFLPLDALCVAPARLVVVAPHPDDEILACGGLLAMRAAEGLPSLVVALSDGEASHGTGDEAACRRLALRRREESQSGLRALGLHAAPVVRMGLPDGGIGAGDGSLAAKLALRLRPTDMVVVTWCMDGHPDHEAAAEAAIRAASATGCRLLQAPVWMWHWAEPGDARIPWDSMLALRLSESARLAKQAALYRHRSQLEDRGAGLGPVLVPSILERAARATEYFFE